jgi:chromosome partitioning protein
MTAKKPPSKRVPKVVVVINQKGGPGKTTISFHLAHAAAATRKTAKVLCLDLDSQGNLSQYLTDDFEISLRTEGGVGSLFEGVPFQPMATSHPQIELLHGHKELDRYDADPEANDRGWDPAMREFLHQLDYDFIIIDTPPALGLRHLAPLSWADKAVIPMEPAMSGIAGFQDVVKVIDQAIVEVNPQIEWVAIINRANKSARPHREKEVFMRENYGSRILETLTSRTGVAEAMDQTPAVPVWQRKGTPKELRELWLRTCKVVLK